MTKINWTTATDAEKCHAVATKLGWTNLVFFNNPYYPRMWAGTPPGEVRTANGPFDSGTPDYLDDPRAWWPLVEEMLRLAFSLGSTPGEAACIAYLRANGVEVVT